MLADGYAVKVTADEDGQETELVFEGRDFERKFFSPETNQSFVACFLDHAKRDPLTGEVGKTICFAVSRKHATKLVTLLNEEATRRWPEAYGAGSAFAVQVTSDIPGAQQMTMDFANNNLNGKSRWRAAEFRDYDTSRTRVCVTVGMMTTGYDCEDVLNVVLARPIFSPTDFIQIKGRGTRLFTFKHHDGTRERTAAKDGFALFDFFANCEFFEDEFDYDEQLALPKGPPPPPGPGPDGGLNGPPGGTKPETYTNTSPDPLALLAAEDGSIKLEWFHAGRLALRRLGCHGVLPGPPPLESSSPTGRKISGSQTLLRPGAGGARRGNRFGTRACRGYGSASATSSAGTPRAPIATTMYCRSLTM